MSKHDFKDHFSDQAEEYRTFRPSYPESLFKYLASIAPARDLAWDCATGTGQAALGLAGYFDNVIATDASEKQIANAVPHRKIDYRVAPAERTHIAEGSVDLITVAQALHWFELNAFFTESRRVLKENGIIAVWSYNLLKISTGIDAVIERFYHDVVGKCWPPERRLVEGGYKNIPFPFREIRSPRFNMIGDWPLDHLVGYLGTWSAVQKYKDANGDDPIKLIVDELKDAWGEPENKQKILWPLALRVGTYDT